MYKKYEALLNPFQIQKESFHDCLTSNQSRMIELGKRVFLAPDDFRFEMDPFEVCIKAIEALEIQDMNSIIQKVFKEEPACSIITK